MILSRLNSIPTSPWLRGQLPVLAGLALPLVWFVVENGVGVLERLAVVGAVAVFWQVVFARIRNQGFGLEGVSMAVLVALLTPESAPVWQLALGGTFGIVIGLLVFGGLGRNVLHPAVVALAFLMFSFAADGYRDTPQIALWTLAPALIVLLVAGQANWRILAGAVAAFALMGWAQGDGALFDLGGTGLFWLVLLFLVADPVASAATNWGRLAHGALYGVLAALFLQAGTAVSALVFAVLMAAIFAPLLDQLVIAANTSRRARRHG
jgi:Na+-transporting NADH:ubiquinone oxidoreductase subunit B